MSLFRHKIKKNTRPEQFQNSYEMNWPPVNTIVLDFAYIVSRNSLQINTAYT